jgi:hypothetical protein
VVLDINLIWVVLTEDVCVVCQISASTLCLSGALDRVVLLCSWLSARMLYVGYADREVQYKPVPGKVQYVAQG